MNGTPKHAASMGERAIRLLLGALLIGGVCGASAARAAIFYVRTAGNDMNDGLTPATAFQSIRHAAEAISNAGDQVIVGPGTYHEGNISPAHSGIENRPVVFSADTAGTQTGDPPGPVVITPPAEQTTGFIVFGRHDVVIEGFTIDGAVDAGIQVRSNRGSGLPSHSVSITNNVVRNTAKRGIDVSVDGAAHVTGNSTNDNGSSGITVQGEPDSSSSAEVSGNTVTGSLGPGIVVQRVKGASIDSNAISKSTGAGVQVRGSSGVGITRNAVRDGQDGGIGIGTGALIIGDCNQDGAVTIDEVVIGVNMALGSEPMSACAAFDPYDDGTVTVTALIRATNELLGVHSANDLGGDYTVADNAVENNAKFGIDITANGQVMVQRNRVLHSGSTAVSVRLLDQVPVTRAAATGTTVPVVVVDNTLGVSGTHGVFLSGMQSGTVQNNVVFSNGDTGITARAANNVQVANNLVYANQGHGVAIGTGGETDGASNASIVDNTLYSNGGFGLVVGNEMTASPGALIVNNIVNSNAGGGVGIQRLSAAAGYVTGFNLNTDGYGPDTRAGVYDFVGNPLFVNPPGPDGVLGGDGYADDDFRLRDGTDPTKRSAAIDAGSGLTTNVGITGASVDGSQSDTGTVDVGYHYDASQSQQVTVSVPDLYMPIYVRVGGSADNDGLSPAQAFNSIALAAQRATSSTTIIVGPGRYNEGDIHVRDLVRDVHFLADPSGIATGDPPGVVLVDVTGTSRDTGFILANTPGTIIDGFHVTGGNAAGIQVRTGSDGSQIRNNVVFSNQRSGIESLGSNDVTIENNLVYANRTGGIRVADCTNAAMVNNTSYRNGAVGILTGGGEDLSPTIGTVVMRNIVQGNVRGILATDNALEGYVTGFNVSADGFDGHTPRVDSDFKADPLFVDPSGSDGVLGGAGFADDDFHLVQGGAVVSPAVDIDYTAVDTLTNGSTREDGVADAGAADAGYHYPVLAPTPSPTNAPPTPTATDTAPPATPTSVPTPPTPTETTLTVTPTETPTLPTPTTTSISPTATDTSTVTPTDTPSPTASPSPADTPTAAETPPTATGTPNA